MNLKTDSKHNFDILIQLKQLQTQQVFTFHLTSLWKNQIIKFCSLCFLSYLCNGFSRKRARSIRFRGKKYKRLLFIHKTFRNLQVEEQYTE